LGEFYLDAYCTTSLGIVALLDHHRQYKIGISQQLCKRLGGDPTHSEPGKPCQAGGAGSYTSLSPLPAIGDKAQEARSQQQGGRFRHRIRCEGHTRRIDGH